MSSTITRSARFLARVDAEIARQSPAAAQAFLERTRRAWERLYVEWQRAVDCGLPLPANVPADASAWDFSETIDGLSVRLGRMQREAA